MLDARASRPGDDDFYPYYSEEPVTESDWHRVAIRYLEGALSEHFAGRSDAYVSSNVFVYYQEGDKEKCVSPDVFVCFGSTKEQRFVHRTWMQGTPHAVVEVTSESSRLSDQGEKRVRYTVMGVQEYILFDPLGEYLPGKLRVYRREGEELVPVVCGPSYESPGLGVTFKVEACLLRVYETETGRRLLSFEEAQAEAQLQSRRADQEAARAEQEAARAEQEAARAEHEAARAEAAEKRNQHLEEELRRLRS